MGRRGTETDFELATIERLEAQGYVFLAGDDLPRDHAEVVLRDHLRANFAARYPELPAATLDEAVVRFARPDGVDTIRRNLAFHGDLTRGIEVEVERDDGRREHRHLYAIDWDHPDRNEFLIVNQLPVRGRNDRRPDLVLYVNGLPLVLMELKNPWDRHPTAEGAINQIRHYTNDIPQLFDFNALTVASDGITTLHGTWTSSPEWYGAWKSIDGVNVEQQTTGSMKTLVEGLFRLDRLLAFVRHFVLFEVANERIVKKAAKYHQFFAVLTAVDRAIAAFRSGGDKRLGVIWHTTGSGKSLSMLFLVGILRRHQALENPTFVVEVDRSDLDDQLHDQFVAGHALVGPVSHADSVEELRSLLGGEGGEVIFTTIEKFRLGPDEIAHPVLSTRSNVIVIADEAHRSQYGFLKGYARYLADALPNARRLGFTGTPVSFSGADTVEVFGDVIHAYDIRQSQEDKATVPIYYEPRQVRLHLTSTDVDAALAEIASGEAVTDLERRKSRWAALAAAAGTRERVADLARDLLTHFQARTATLDGKAMAVCMTRANAVRLYAALTALTGCPEVKVVMTGNLAEDPVAWSEAGHITTKHQRDAIKQRMIDHADPLKIVIVCDMWLTGTDIPCLHTLYIDKPMKGHNIIQAISRVNRVFSDKPNGLVVDYIGIGDDLREAAGQYSAGGGRGEPAPGVSEEAGPLFVSAVDSARALLPAGIDHAGWRRLGPVAFEDLHTAVYAHLAGDEELRDRFIEAERRVSSAFLLVRHLDEYRGFADEVIVFQRVRQQLLKTIPGPRAVKDVEGAIRDLVDDAVGSTGVVDVFALAGLERADISILDDAFLQTFKDRPFENLRLKLLQKLLTDEITRRQLQNLAQARSFKDLLDATLRKYHARLIDAAAVVRTMVEIYRDMRNADQRAAELGLSEEELAFYDSVAANLNRVYGVEFLRDLVHDVVLAIKRNLKVDWTAPHREDVKAAVRAAVKRVLRQRDVRAEDFDGIVASVMTQAEALYRNWPQAA
jgi:type I restriction enzyme R subunit